HPVEMPLRLRSALNGEARRLVEREDRLVLVNDGAADHLRILVAHRALIDRRRLKLRAKRRHTDDLPRREPRIGLGAGAIDPHLAGAQQLLEPPMRERGETLLEPAVEAKAVFLFAHIYLRNRAHARTALTDQRPKNTMTIEPRTD